MTPEGKIKSKISKVLKAYEPYLYYTMPIGGPYSTSGVPDYLICVAGVFIAVEAKALKKEPTKLQAKCHTEIRQAGGQVWVIDSEDGVYALESEIQMILGV